MEATMDGMNWFRKDETEALAQQAMERRAVRRALIMTAVSIVVAISAVLALSATNLRPTMAEEFVSPPISQ
jgi:hypothetical protein